MILIEILPVEPRMLVPCPSFANTCEELEMETVAVPFVTARKVMLPSPPELPVYPGEGRPQLMAAVEAVYEGSDVYREHMDPPFEIPVAWSCDEYVILTR